MTEDERKLLLLLANIKRNELVYNKDILAKSGIDITLFIKSIEMLDKLVGDIATGAGMDTNSTNNEEV